MSSRLKDGNPNVADLSDENRPVKIGEQFSELYDNQWTDAFSAIETHITLNEQNIQEDDIVTILLHVLQVKSISFQKQITNFSFAFKCRDFFSTLTVIQISFSTFDDIVAFTQMFSHLQNLEL